jgi:Na+/H+-dicarboxylate symporter
MKQTSSQHLYLLIFAIVMGVLIGGFLPAVGEGLSILGELFLRGLLMLVVPLVMMSLITAISSVGEAGQLGKMGQITILYFLSTTAIAVIIGIIVVLMIQPGHAETEAQRIALRGGELLPKVQYRIQGQELTLQDGALKKDYGDRFQLYLQDQPNISGKIEKIDDSKQTINLSEWIGPESTPVLPTASGQGIRIDLSQAHTLRSKERSISSVLHDMALSLVPSNLFHSMANNEILPLITVSIILGITLLTLGEATAPLTQLFDTLNLAIMAIVHGMMKLALSKSSFLFSDGWRIIHDTNEFSIFIHHPIILVNNNE